MHKGTSQENGIKRSTRTERHPSLPLSSPLNKRSSMFTTDWKKHPKKTLKPKVEQDEHEKESADSSGSRQSQSKIEVRRKVKGIGYCRRKPQQGKELTDVGCPPQTAERNPYCCPCGTSPGDNTDRQTPKRCRSWARPRRYNSSPLTPSLNYNLNSIIQNCLILSQMHISQKALLANVQCNESLVWFKASGLWHTIITGHSPELLSDILQLPQYPMDIVPQDQSLLHVFQQVIDEVDAKVDQPKALDVGLGGT
ncbi:hypothetical protein STEG23_013633 [Scotinomys teguina]